MPAGQEVHVMSNGLSYAKDKDGKWYVACNRKSSYI